MAEPRSFGRGSFDRIVCTEPLAFAADAVIYLWDFNGSQIAWVGFAAARSGESGGKDFGSCCDRGPAGLSESTSCGPPPGLERTPALRARARHRGWWMES